MTSAQVQDALALRWPDSEYLSIAEAPEDSSRMGRKIDVLVVSLWASRGLELDAVEIKVSYSDWARERKQAEKADFWWRHTHRFWVAVPAALAAKVAAELPTGWGLLSCEIGAAPKVVAKPQRHDAEPLTWPTMVGVMRAAADCGLSALHRAEQRGRAQGFEEGKRNAERNTAEGVTAASLKELQWRVEAFEQASGLNIDHRYERMDRLGELVAVVRREMEDPGWLVRLLGGTAEITVQQAERLVANAKKVQEAAGRVSAALAEARREVGV